jgi:hypothetical protein
MTTATMSSSYSPASISVTAWHTGDAWGGGGNLASKIVSIFDFKPKRKKAIDGEGVIDEVYSSASKYIAFFAREFSVFGLEASRRHINAELHRLFDEIDDEELQFVPSAEATEQLIRAIALGPRRLPSISVGQAGEFSLSWDGQRSQLNARVHLDGSVSWVLCTGTGPQMTVESGSNAQIEVLHRLSI